MAKLRVKRMVRSLIFSSGPLGSAVLGRILFGHAANPASWLGYGQVGLVAWVAYGAAALLFVRRRYYEDAGAKLCAKGKDPAWALEILGVNVFLGFAGASAILCLFGLPLWQHYLVCAFSFAGILAWPIWLERHPPAG